MRSSNAVPGISRLLRITFWSAFVGAQGAALLDLAISIWREPAPVTWPSMAQAAAAMVGLYGLAGAAIGASAAITLGAVASTLSTHRTWHGIRARLRNDPEFDRSAAAALTATVGSVTVIALASFVWVSAFSFNMTHRHNAALSTAMMVALSTPLAALAWFPLFRAAWWVAAVLPRPRTLLLAVIVGLLLASLLAAAVGSVDWLACDFGPVTSLLVLTLSAAMLAALAHAGVHDRLRRLGPGRTRFLAASMLGLVVLAFVVTWTTFGRDQRALDLVAEESIGARTLLHAVRHLADHDGDHYAERLGGCDCDDTNPRIYPGAHEVPGNHIDEDCDGVDTPAQSARAMPSRDLAPVPPPWKGNLLVITVDALRADRMTPATMPRLAGLAQRGVVFANAYAQSSDTSHSLPSFVTSRFPGQLLRLSSQSLFEPLRAVPENATFFEALHAAGMRTVGIFAHVYLGTESGLARGFDEWDNSDAVSLAGSNLDSAAPRTTARIVAKLNELRQTHQPWVLWTHLFEPHAAYVQHPEFPVRRFASIEERYDAEVRYTDLHIGKLLDALTGMGMADATAIVVMADHGEAFGEHRFAGQHVYYHGQTIYEELIRVPLVIHVPGITSPRVIEGRVMLLDVGPTLVELFGARRPDSFVGRSLLPAMLGAPLPPAPVYAELLPSSMWNRFWRAFIDHDHKLIHRVSEGLTEVYDLRSDPAERHNVVGQDERTAHLQEGLRRFLARGRDAVAPLASAD